MYICKPIGSVDTCPVTKKAWEARAELLKDECDFESDYHCLPDNEGVKWEKCIQKTLILEGNMLELRYFPIFLYALHTTCTINYYQLPFTERFNQIIYERIPVYHVFYFTGNCPMYTSDGYLDWKPCNISDLSCPNSSYVSNEVYKCKYLSVVIIHSEINFH